MASQTSLRKGKYQRDQGSLKQTGKDQTDNPVATNQVFNASVHAAPQGRAATNTAYPYKTKQAHI